MGLRVDRDSFDATDHERFAERLQQGLEVLQELLRRPGFGCGERSLGAEAEFSLVDAAARPLPLNRAVLVRALDPHVQLELDRFNLEYNLTPVPCAGQPFSALQRELERAIARLDAAATLHGGRVVLIGILPTLRQEDLDRHSMTDLPRYRALSHAIRELRDGPARVQIHGPEPLTVAIDDVTMEGAATSLQVHLRVEPAEFARTYNAAQAATALALAVSSNSPLFLGHRLWAETRIALFKQAVDSRPRSRGGIRMPSRVAFGYGWARHGVHELFAENVSLFPSLIPCLAQESPRQQLGSGRVPELSELRLHSGTVWRWNRPVFDPADGGHLRIELRALPAGPTPLDSMANAAFLVGLTLGLRGELDRLLPSFPFEYAHDNFYRAAEHGLDARLTWPAGARAPVLERLPAVALVERLMPAAREGLLHAGVETAEVTRLLDVIARRASSGRTGARWQLAMLAHLEPELGREAALAELTQRYVELSRSGTPVDGWSLP